MFSLVPQGYPGLDGAKGEAGAPGVKVRGHKAHRGRERGDSKELSSQEDAVGFMELGDQKSLCWEHLI
jgi:hypothetical protein